MLKELHSLELKKESFQLYLKSYYQTLKKKRDFGYDPFMLYFPPILVQKYKLWLTFLITVYSTQRNVFEFVKNFIPGCQMGKDERCIPEPKNQKAVHFGGKLWYRDHVLHDVFLQCFGIVHFLNLEKMFTKGWNNRVGMYAVSLHLVCFSLPSFWQTVEEGCLAQDLAFQLSS